MKTPCKDCNERSVLCHAACPTYIRYLEDLRCQREARQAEYRARPEYVRKFDSPYRL